MLLSAAFGPTPGLIETVTAQAPPHGNPLSDHATILDRGDGLLELEPDSFQPVGPAGGLIYETPEISGQIEFLIPTERFEIEIDGQQALTVAVAPDATLQPMIELLNPDGDVIATAGAPLIGMRAVLQSSTIDDAGTYAVRISGRGGSTGSYTTRFWLNTATELESTGSTTNNRMALAQDLNASFISIGGTAQRGAVVGSIDIVPPPPPPAGSVLDEPNDTIPLAVQSGIGHGVNTFIDSGHIGDNLAISGGLDVDLIRVDLNDGDTINIDIDAAVIGSPLDTALNLFDSAGDSIAFNDDSDGLDSFISTTVSADGSYYVGISDLRNFGYDPFVQGSGSGGVTGNYDVSITVIPAVSSSSETTHVQEDFESGILGPQWQANSSTPSGRIRVTGDVGTAEGSGHALVMDNLSAFGDFNLNEAVWTVDLSGVTDATLRFWHAEWGDEQAPFTGEFTGSFNADGVAISDDGNHWHPVLSPPNQLEGVWMQYAIDLAAEAAAAGVTLGPGFQIKFQQFDNFDIPTDGRAYDQITITTPDDAEFDAEDWYRFTLDQGESATVLVDRDVALELYDSDGELLLQGVETDNRGRVIDGVVAPVADTYFVRIAEATADDYRLIVTRNTVFDAEPNNEIDSAQDITDTGAALGHIGEPGGHHLGRLFTYDALNDLVQEINIETGEALHTFPPPISFSLPVRFGLATTSDTLLAAGPSDHDILELNPDTLETLRAIPNPGVDVNGMAFLGNEIYLLSDDSGQITVIDYDTGEVTRTLTPGPGLIVDALAATGDHLLGSDGTTLYAVDPFNGSTTALGTLPIIPEFFEALGVIGDELFVGVGNQIHVLDLVTLSILRSSPTFFDALEAIGADSGRVVEPDVADQYAIAANAGDMLLIHIDLPAGGPGAFTNTLDPAVELFDPAGVSVAFDAGGAITHLATEDGVYTVRVTAEGGTRGEYALLATANVMDRVGLNDFERLEPLGGMMFVSRENNGSLPDDRHVDLFEFNLEGGQTVSAIALPDNPSAVLSLELNGNRFTAPGEGEPVVLPPLAIGADETVLVQVSADSETGYSMDVYLNAALEAVLADSDDGAEVDINGSRIDLGSGRFGVIGSSRPPHEDGVIFSENFDGGTGGFVIDNGFGSGGGLWHRSSGRSADGDPNHTPPNSLYYGQNEGPLGGGDYDTGFTNGGAVFSPTVSLPIDGPIQLSFNHLLQTEGDSAWDIAEVSVDAGSGFVTLLSTENHTLSPLGTGGGWETVEVDLTPFAGNFVTLRWSFDTLDDILNDFEGWYIDDVLITGPGESPEPDLVLYGAAGDGVFGSGESSLYQIDPDSGDATLIGPIGFSGVTGMTFLNDGRLVATSLDEFGSDAALIEIDPATGTGELIGNLHDPASGAIFRMPGLGYDAENDLLYGHGFGLEPSLYLIDPDTGTSDLIGETGFSGAGNGLDVQPGTGVIYATPSENLSLVTIDPLTGAASEVPGSASKVPPRVNGLDFHPDTGVLYGSLNNTSETGHHFLVTIDTSDGTTTIVGETVVGLDAVAWGPDSGGVIGPPSMAEPNDTIPEAIVTGIVPGGAAFTVSGEIGDNPDVPMESDVDMYRVDLKAGERVTVDIDAIAIGSMLDSVLRLFDAAGTELAVNDDSDFLDSFIDFTVSFDDSYYVGVSSFNNFSYDPFVEDSGTATSGSNGAYQITVIAFESDLALEDPAGPDDPLKISVDGVDESLVVTGYSTQDDPGSMLIIQDDGTSIGISGNGWKKAAFDSPITITENTVLSFDFESPMLAELQGIGFDNDDDVANEGTIFFQVAGTDSAFPNLVTEFADYPQAGGLGESVRFQIPVGQFITGDFAFITFFNDDDATPVDGGESVFSNISIFDVATLTVTVNDTAQHLDVTGYSSQNDPASIVEIEDVGNTVRVTGNGWWKVAFDTPITVTESTVLGFDFSSPTLAELQGIGFDNDEDVVNEDTFFFQVAGTDSAFPNLNTEFADYPQGGLLGDVVHYEIPLGEFFTGEFSFLTFFNDDDVAPQDGQSAFSGITLFEQPLVVTVDGIERPAAPVGYSSQDDPASSVSVQELGATAELTGNAWKQVVFDDPLVITESTILSFDFSSSMLAELQGIGFDNDEDVANEGTFFFQVAGTDSAFPNLNTDFADYPQDGLLGDIVHYEIPVGDYLTGTFSSLVLFNDDDVEPHDGTSVFSNIELFERPLTITVNGTQQDLEVLSYSVQDDAASETRVPNGGVELQLTGNAWKKVIFDEPITVTEHTVMSFDFSSARLAELQGIGLDNDEDVTNEGTALFQVAGTDSAFPNLTTDFADYPFTGSLGDVVRYEIPLGRYVTGEFAFLTFFNDHDLAPQDGTGTFSNIELFENSPRPTDVDEYTLELTAGQAVDVVLAGQGGADFGAVNDELIIDSFEGYDPGTDNPIGTDPESRPWARVGGSSAGDVIAIDDDRAISGDVSGLYPLTWWSPIGSGPISQSARFHFDSPTDLRSHDTISFKMKSDLHRTGTTVQLVLTNGLHTYQSRTQLRLTSDVKTFTFGLDESSFDLLDAGSLATTPANYARALANATQVGFLFRNPGGQGSESIIFDDFIATDRTTTLELIDTDGHSVLATGGDHVLDAASDNYDQAILGFEVPSDGEYTLRISSEAVGEYGLVVTDSLVFDTEPNHRPAAPTRSLDGAGGAIGFLGDDPSILDGTLYGISRDGELFAIDLSTGTPDFIGFLPASSTEIECDLTTGQCFSQRPNGAFEMQQFDIATGAGIGGSVSNGAAFNGLEFVDGVLYGTAIPFSGEPSNLRILDPFTGLSTVIGATGRGPIAGLAWDPIAEVMYGIDGGSGSSSLMTINLDTGVATVIGSTGFQAGSLEFGPDGVLYGGGTGANGGELFAIDPATGVSTFIGSMGVDSLTGLALGPSADTSVLIDLKNGAAPWIAPLDESGVSQRIVVVDDPALHVIEPGEGFDGVVDLTISRLDGTVGCSGALLSSGRHILTAAHCIADDFGGGLIATGGTVRFDLPDGPVTISIENFIVHPDYNGNTLDGFDIARSGVPTIDPSRIRERAGGGLAIQVVPNDSFDGALFGGITCETWLEKGVAPGDVSDNQASFYKQKDPEGGVSLVLGAGNVASIPPMDVLYKMFVEGRVCILKMNPVNEYLGPFIERAFKPLVDKGYLAIAYGGADVGSYLCHHDSVDDIHITGSDKTHDAIVWGPPGEEREERKRNDKPLLSKPISSELGNISPVIVVPGPYNDAELDSMAFNIAGMVTNNASFNCNAAKMLVLPKGWEHNERLVDRIGKAMALVPPRKAYYPGAQKRYDFLTENRDGLVKIGDPGKGAAPVDDRARPRPERRRRAQLQERAILRDPQPGRARQHRPGRVPQCGGVLRERRALGHVERDAVHSSQERVGHRGPARLRGGAARPQVRDHRGQPLGGVHLRSRDPALGRAPELHAQGHPGRPRLGPQHPDAREDREGGGQGSHQALPQAPDVSGAQDRSRARAQDGELRAQPELVQGSRPGDHGPARLTSGAAPIRLIPPDPRSGRAPVRGARRDH